jgi:hypothetical protein
MDYEEKIQAVLNVLCKHTMPKDQFGFTTERQVCEEILNTIGIYN